MKTNIPSTAERFRRFQRDLRAYRQRSLWRRSHARFHRDLTVQPHLFLAPGAVRAADLLRSGDDVLEALRGRVVWTLDTAGRLSCGIGFLATRDLTAYMSRETFDQAVDERLVEPVRPASISVTPTWERAPMLIAHLEDPPAFFVLESGDRVLTWTALVADIKGTIGWRPDILTRLEDAYLDTENTVGKCLAPWPPSRQRSVERL